jgi:tRNA threonylcarbamoyladenosine dehydratase
VLSIKQQQLSASYQERFGSIGRLYGSAALSRLAAAHVAIIGLGGVGSWAVEALARSGIGTLTLIDLDDVCVTNTARQIPAIVSTVGQPKVEALAARVRSINPEIIVHPRASYLLESTVSSLLEPRFTYVIDAIDKYSHKLLLLGECLRRKLPVLTCGAAGGRRDPGRVHLVDLGISGRDLLLKQIRRGLRRHYGIAHGEGVHFGIPCVCSTESPVFPWQDGTVRAEPEPACPLTLDCHTGFGAASFVTGVFGLQAAGEVVRSIAGPSQALKPYSG